METRSVDAAQRAAQLREHARRQLERFNSAMSFSVAAS